MNETNSNRNEDPTAGDLILDLWWAKFWIIAGGIAGVCVAFIFFAVAVPQYKTEMIVGPRAGALIDNAAGSIAGIEGSEQAEAATEGIDSQQDFIAFEAVMRGPQVASALMDDDLIINGVGEKHKFSFLSAEKPKSEKDLSLWLQKNVRVSPVFDTPLKIIHVKHPDKEFGQYLLQKMHRITDDHVKNNQASRIDAKIDFLRQAAEKFRHPTHRNVYTDILVQQEQVKLALALDEPFAAQIIEQPYTGPRPVWPRKIFFVPLFTAGFMMLGYMIYGLRKAMKQANS